MTTKPYVYNENPNLFWGDETHFVITALKDFVKAQKESLEKIAVDGKTPFFTPEYFDQMSEIIIGKILELQQPQRPEIKVSNHD